MFFFSLFTACSNETKSISYIVFFLFKNAFCSVLFLSCVKSLVSIQSAIHVSTWILLVKRSRGFGRWFNRIFSHCPVVQGYLTLLSLQCCFSFLLFLFTSIAMWGSATDHKIAIYIYAINGVKWQKTCCKRIHFSITAFKVCSKEYESGLRRH